MKNGAPETIGLFRDKDAQLRELRSQLNRKDVQLMENIRQIEKLKRMRNQLATGIFNAPVTGPTNNPLEIFHRSGESVTWPDGIGDCATTARKQSEFSLEMTITFNFNNLWCDQESYCYYFLQYIFVECISPNTTSINKKISQSCWPTDGCHPLVAYHFD